jgi:hypothetical protein
LISGTAVFEPSLIRIVVLLRSKIVGLRTALPVVIDNVEEEVPILGT